MIYSTEPETWQQLEQWVANVFNDIGCVAVAKHSATATRRGNDGAIEVDVWVEDRRKKPVVNYHIECKRWSTKKVPRTVVSALINDMSATGANQGMIITTSGFQKGAIETAVGTPIELFTFDQFQEQFWQPWVVQRFKGCLDELSNHLHQITLARMSVFMKTYSTIDEDLSGLSPEILADIECLSNWIHNLNIGSSFFTARHVVPPEHVNEWQRESVLNSEEVLKLVKCCNDKSERTSDNYGGNIFSLSIQSVHLPEILIEIETAFDEKMAEFSIVSGIDFLRI